MLIYAVLIISATLLLGSHDNHAVTLRGRSQLSTFMKAYREYARGGGLGLPYAFPPKIIIYF